MHKKYSFLLINCSSMQAGQFTIVSFQVIWTSQCLYYSFFGYWNTVIFRLFHGSLSRAATKVREMNSHPYEKFLSILYIRIFSEFLFSGKEVFPTWKNKEFWNLCSFLWIFTNLWWFGTLKEAIPCSKAVAKGLSSCY